MKALVLVGGGACGEWQAGCLSKLHENGELGSLQVIVGNSAGALNAGLYGLGLMRGVGTQTLYAAWERIKRTEDIYTPALPPTAGLVLNPFAPSYLNGLRRFFFGPGFADTTPLKKLAEEIFGTWTAQDVYERTGVSIFVRAFNYGTGKVETLGGAMRLADMALASSAIEGIFPAHNVNGVEYGDGGLLDNAPMDVALELGADNVRIIYCAPEKSDEVEPPKTGLLRALRAVGRAIEAHEERVWEECQKRPGVVWAHYYPSQDTGSFLDFSKRGLWEQGRNDASQK